MLCPFCSSEQVFVVNSRSTKSNSQTWRRKKCSSCLETFTTYEKIDLSFLNVIKKSGRKQRYNRAKLFSGIYQASVDTKGADRGDMSNFAEDITNEVEKRILRLKRKNISTLEITDILLSIIGK